MNSLLLRIVIFSLPLFLFTEHNNAAVFVEKWKPADFIPAGFGQSNSQIEKDPGGYSIIKNGKELLFYRFSAEPFRLKTITPTQSFEAYWLHPYTGEKRKITTITNQLVTPPAEWAGNPVVLYISKL